MGLSPSVVEAAVAGCTSAAVDSAAVAWASADSAAAVSESAVLEVVLDFAQRPSAALGVPDWALPAVLDGALPDVLDGALEAPDGVPGGTRDGVRAGPSPVGLDGGVRAGASVGAVGAGASRSRPASVWAASPPIPTIATAWPGMAIAG